MLGLLVHTASAVLFFQCIGFTQQGAGSRVAAGVQGKRSRIVPMLDTDSSKMDLLLAEAEPISLKKGKKMLGRSCERQG